MSSISFQVKPSILTFTFNNLVFHILDINNALIAGLKSEYFKPRFIEICGNVIKLMTKIIFCNYSGFSFEQNLNVLFVTKNCHYRWCSKTEFNSISILY